MAEKKLKEDGDIKQFNSNIILALVILSAIVVVLVGLVVVLRNDVKNLNNEIIRIKDVLKEYGVYIDPQENNAIAYDTSVYNIINPSDIEKESKDKAIVVWIGRQSCGYCAMYAPYINEAMNNYGFRAYYVDLATLINFDVPQPYVTNQEELDILSNLPGEGKWKGFASENVGGTPLTLIIKDSKVIGGLSGYADTQTVMKVFEEAGLKKLIVDK